MARILVADNDKLYADSIKRLLESYQHKVIVPKDLNDARAQLRAKRIHFAIIDVHLIDFLHSSHQNGLDFAREIASEIPVVLVSPYPSSHMMSAAYHSHAPGKLLFLRFVKKTDPKEPKTKLIEAMTELFTDTYNFDPFLAPQTRIISTRPNPFVRTVFIVHGRDKQIRQHIKTFVVTEGYRPIILEEQTGNSRTIIEQFEAHAARVDHAVAILTPEDIGYLKRKSPKLSDIQKRARQNVILELGYFMGKLGRGNVSAIYVGEVDPPSDLHGIIYIPWDSPNGTWKIRLKENMGTAKLPLTFGKIK